MEDITGYPEQCSTAAPPRLPRKLRGGPMRRDELRPGYQCLCAIWCMLSMYDMIVYVRYDRLCRI